MTVLSTGLIGSDTIACSTWLEIGSRNPAMAAQHAGMAGDGDGDLLGADGAARGLDAGDAAVLDPETGDFAVLDDVDAARIGRAREAPGDGIVARHAAAALQAGADDRDSAPSRPTWMIGHHSLSCAGVRNSESMPLSLMA